MIDQITPHEAVRFAFDALDPETFWHSPKELAPLHAALSQGGSPDQRSSTGDMLLNLAVLRACRQKNANVHTPVNPLVALLLTFDADPNRAMTDDEWGTPVRDAAGFVSPALLAALLAAGGDPSGRIAPHHPHEIGDFETDARSTTEVDPNPGRTALHHAYGAEHVQRLVDAGADLNAQDANGLTPLHMTLDKVSTSAFEALLDLGADPNRVDHKGHAPLHKAGSVHHVQRLIAFGADPSIQNENGQTPLAFMQHRHTLRQRAIDLARATAQNPNGHLQHLKNLGAMIAILERLELEKMLPTASSPRATAARARL